MAAGVTTTQPHLEELRGTAVSLLSGVLADFALASAVEAAIVTYCDSVSDLECISNEHELYRSLYVSKARELVDNLNPASYVHNTDLRQRLQDGDVSADQLPFMTPQQLFPENWKELIQEKQRKDELKYNVTQQAMTNVYKCRRCGGRRITYIELQLRSADEGATQCFSCLDCGSKWRKN